MIARTRTKEEWQKIVDEFVTSQKTKKAYCKENEIQYGVFRNWYYRLRTAGTTEKISEGRLDEIANINASCQLILYNYFV